MYTLQKNPSAETSLYKYWVNYSHLIWTMDKVLQGSFLVAPKKIIMSIAVGQNDVLLLKKILSILWWKWLS